MALFSLLFALFNVYNNLFWIHLPGICTSDTFFLFKRSTVCKACMYNHMVGRAASFVSPFYSILLGFNVYTLHYIFGQCIAIFSRTLMYRICIYSYCPVSLLSVESTQEDVLCNKWLARLQGGGSHKITLTVPLNIFSKNWIGLGSSVPEGETRL